MSTQALAGTLLILLPIAFNVALLTGVALTQTAEVPGWVGVLGIVIGPLLMLCSLEFVGRSGDHGWSVAEKLTPIAYTVWSLWLVIAGVALIA